MRTVSRPAAIVVLLTSMFAAVSLNAPSFGQEASFDVLGNSSVDDILPPGYESGAPWPFDESTAVKVTFDLVPMTITGVSVSNVTYELLNADGAIHARLFTGSLETYDDQHPANPDQDPYSSWESPASPFNSIWWQSKNAARILVRMRTAMVWENWEYGPFPDVYPNPIAREDLPESPNPKVTPAWPPSRGRDWRGEWAEEFYWIYPDGVHTRHAMIFTQAAETTEAFGTFEGARMWPNSVHDGGDLQIWYSEAQGPLGTMERHALTLMKMDGTSRSYPFVNPFLESGQGPGFDNLGMMEGGLMQRSNIAIVNFQDSSHNGFLIGTATEGSDFRYSVNEDGDYLNEGNAFPDHEFPSLPLPEEGTGGLWTPFGFLIDQAFHRRVPAGQSAMPRVEFLWLRGVVPAATDEQDALLVARSWLTPPMLTIQSEGFSGGGYSREQRAYLIERGEGDGPLEVSIAATVAEPLARPAIVVEDWGMALATEILLDGQLLDPGTDYRQGLEGDSLVVWLNQRSESEISLRIEPAGMPALIFADGFESGDTSAWSS